MENRSSNYHAYLLRLWRDETVTPWRATLEDPHTGEVIGFSTLQQLYIFLDEQTEMESSKNNQGQ